MVIGHVVEVGLRIVRPRRHGGRQLEDLLPEERHFLLGIRVVERDHVRQRLARERHARARREIAAQVVAELEAQHEKLAVRRREREARAVEIDERRARGFHLFEDFIERRDDLRRRGVDALTCHAEARAVQAVLVEW